MSSRPSSQILGAPLDRVDGPQKTTGQARYSAEYPLPNLAHAEIVHASVASGRITAIETKAAEATPGVLRVLTHLNAAKLKPTSKPTPISLPTLAPGTLVNYLNTDEVHYDGQPIAVVIAETLDAAHQAAALVQVTYAESPARVDLDAEQGSAKDVRGLPVGPVQGGKKGDAVKALAKAEVRVDQHYSTPEHTHNALEPHATTAVWEGNGLTVYDGAQNLEWTAKHLAAKFELKVENVRVVSPFVGGAFGGKTNVWPQCILAVMAAREVQRPVRLALTREGVGRTVGGRTAALQRLAIGADRSGHMTALIHEATTRKGTVGGNVDQMVSCSADCYAADNILLGQKLVSLNRVPNSPMRAPGEATGTFALESAVDELAHELGMDPLELRLKNQPERGPVNGVAFSHHTVAESLQFGAERFGWADRTAAPGSMRDGNHYVGWGVATAIHPAWQFPTNLTLRLDDSGHLHVRCAFHEMGMGTATAATQIAAELFGLRPSEVTVEYGDSSLPTGPGAGGSAQTASIADSLTKGRDELVKQLHELAQKADGPLRGTKRDQVTVRAGGLTVGDQRATYVEILRGAGRAEVTTKVGSDVGLGALKNQVGFAAKLIRDSRRWNKAASGAQFCEVRIDADTGEIRVTRWVGVFDIGRVVNAKTASSQLRGGIVMGLGLALSEEALFDPRNGRLMNPSLTEYHVPVHADVPPIDIHCLDDPDPAMPMGILGAGEVSITGVGAAVANAVFHATGKRVRDLPITLDKVLP